MQIIGRKESMTRNNENFKPKTHPVETNGTLNGTELVSSNRIE
jgi:hypothetical protein